ncbi:hypothetical protein [Allostreptomyces psammosilenae]|uniref:Carbon monoxide dehydrogenase subunit G n=1 Tax=Allostreptomyces psammosilenae TaxID=1892865 RepID=A0A852ZTR0_9ACTN|nr:hypothetical protein [Allostreptomyces psammosilenae]NYI05235.1 carbon monoxide dehydrogenase subunit G [Allostreptomyces psammosilenae]
MRHEIPVDAPLRRVWGVLHDPAALAAALPGFQPGDEDAATGAGARPRAETGGADPAEDADPGPLLAGRLRVRAGTATVTYRGSLRVEDTGPHTLRADLTAREVRGGEPVAAVVDIRLSPAPRPSAADAGSTLLVLDIVGEAGGRLGALAPRTRETALRRLLDRFGRGLTEHLSTTGAATEPDGEDAGAPDPFAEAAEAPGTVGAAGAAEGIEPPDAAEERRGYREGVAEAAVGRVVPGEVAEETIPEEPAAASAAARTMITRSEEEVDHAPPRGRYAPVPAARDRQPVTAPGGTQLRWVVLAALAVGAVGAAGAVGVVRRARAAHVG